MSITGQLPDVVNSSSRPAAVFFNTPASPNGAVILYKGANDDQRMFIATFNGSWSEGSVISGAVNTNDGPSAIFDEPSGTLYVAYKGAWTDTAIYALRSTDYGASWQSTTFPDVVNTSATPSAFVADGVLYVAYVGVPGDQRLFVAALPESAVWADV